MVIGRWLHKYIVISPFRTCSWEAIGQKLYAQSSFLSLSASSWNRFSCLQHFLHHFVHLDLVDGEFPDALRQFVGRHLILIQHPPENFFVHLNLSKVDTVKAVFGRKICSRTLVLYKEIVRYFEQTLEGVTPWAGDSSAPIPFVSVLLEMLVLPVQGLVVASVWRQKSRLSFLVNRLSTGPPVPWRTFNHCYYILLSFCTLL